MQQVDTSNGIVVSEANNWAETAIELNFDKGETKAQLSITEYEMGVGDKANPTDLYTIGKKHFTDGILGGVGVGEGFPYRRQIESNGRTEILFDGYLDLWRAKYECGKITAQAFETGGIDWLKSGAADISFEYLASPEGGSKITPSMYVLVPYVIETPDVAGKTFMATITIFSITGQITKVVLDISKDATDVSNPFTTANGIVKLVLQIVYLVALLAALIKLIIDAFKLIVQRVRYHAGMYVNDLLRIGAAELGYTFSSSFLEAFPLNKEVLMPEKFNTKLNNTGGIEDAIKGYFTANKNEQSGYPSMGYTFSDLLRYVQTKYDAKLIIDGQILRIERQNYNVSNTLYTVPPVDINEAFTLNEEDFVAQWYIEYATDINDRNTIQEYTGTAYQVQILPKTFANRQMVLTKRFERISLEMALAKRKTELSFPEKIFDVFFKVADALLGAIIKAINAIIKVVNKAIQILNRIIKLLAKIKIKLNFKIPTIPLFKAPTFGNLIENRIGMMKMETDFISVKKVMLIDEKSDASQNHLMTLNEVVLSAKFLWDNFYFLRSFVPQTGNPLGNQYLIVNIDNVPFCFDDYLLVKSNNLITDADGNNGRIDSLKWNIEKQRTEGLQYRINKTYMNNLIEYKYEPVGN